jgi:hypothetical protein
MVVRNFVIDELLSAAVNSRYNYREIIELRFRSTKAEVLPHVEVIRFGSSIEMRRSCETRNTKISSAAPEMFRSLTN